MDLRTLMFYLGEALPHLKNGQYGPFTCTAGIRREISPPLWNTLKTFEIQGGGQKILLRGLLGRKILVSIGRETEEGRWEIGTQNVTFHSPALPAIFCTWEPVDSQAAPSSLLLNNIWVQGEYPDQYAQYGRRNTFLVQCLCRRLQELPPWLSPEETAILGNPLPPYKINYGEKGDEILGNFPFQKFIEDVIASIPKPKPTKEKLPEPQEPWKQALAAYLVEKK